jgi:type II secretory pathway pseudopilin PulG
MRASPQDRAATAPRDSSGDEGFVLLALLVLIFILLLTLSIAAPKIAMALKREREIETKHRADQYVRAIRVFYRKNGHYPTSMEQLENTNNQRFLRQRYLDPMTGKDDWRLIQAGQNKTTVKGFFGQDLPGLGSGLGMGSGIGSGSSTGGSSTGSSFGSSSTFGSSGSGSTFGSSASFGSGSNGSGSASGSGSGGTGSSGTSSPSSGDSHDATEFKGSTGPIMGVGLPTSGEAILTVNGVSTYEEWEFLYDPRIEQLYAKGATMGGGLSSSSSSSSSGSSTSSGGSSAFGNSNGNGTFGNGNGNGSTPVPPVTPQ